jgi:ParB family chromosome partitioning protein
MELEFHQLDLRYEALRRRAPEREKRLLASLAEHGQQTPIVVVADPDGRHVVVDGYKRVRALKALKVDTLRATSWDLSQAEALLLERLMRYGDADGPLEQAWLLKELHGRFALSQEELARRFDKSVSWVCRRLALVQELPLEIQERVRGGEIVAHAAMKYLVPLARANRGDALKLVAALAGRRASSRQIGALYGAWLSGSAKTRELLLADPWLFLRVQEQARRAQEVDKSPAQQLLSDLGALGGLCRRTIQRLRQGIARGLLQPERAELRQCLKHTRADVEALLELADKEMSDA